MKQKRETYEEFLKKIEDSMKYCPLAGDLATVYTGRKSTPPELAKILKESYEANLSDSELMNKLSDWM